MAHHKSLVMIPKILHQTFKSNQLPWLTQWHINRILNRNPEYTYEFYDDDRICEMIQHNYGTNLRNLYDRINIGAAKADLFRYTVLYQFGGIYLDIDSSIKINLDHYILPTDQAIICFESMMEFYVQWALIFAPKHRFLERTIELIIQNIEANSYPYDVHKMTGPTVYTRAIKACLAEKNGDNDYRLVKPDYDGHFQFSYPMSKFFLYGLKKNWKKEQLVKPVLKSID